MAECFLATKGLKGDTGPQGPQGSAATGSISVVKNVSLTGTVNVDKCTYDGSNGGASQWEASSPIVINFGCNAVFVIHSQSSSFNVPNIQIMIWESGISYGNLAYTASSNRTYGYLKYRSKSSAILTGEASYGSGTVTFSSGNGTTDKFLVFGY